MPFQSGLGICELARGQISGEIPISHAPGSHQINPETWKVGCSGSSLFIASLHHLLP